MALDEAEVREALTEKEARLFLALARSGVPRNLDEFSAKLGEYLGFLADFLTLESSRELAEEFQMDQAHELSTRWRRLLELASDQDERTRLLVATGVRYFVTPQDAESELESRDGFRDDGAVLNFVIGATGLGVSPVGFARAD